MPIEHGREMVQAPDGHLLLLTNHTKNSALVSDTSDKVRETWRSKYPRTLRLTLFNDVAE